MRGIESSNLSKIHFISKCLRKLRELDILERIERTKRIKYKIKIEKKNDIPNFIENSIT